MATPDSGDAGDDNTVTAVVVSTVVILAFVGGFYVYKKKTAAGLRWAKSGTWMLPRRETTQRRWTAAVTWMLPQSTSRQMFGTRLKILVKHDSSVPQCWVFQEQYTSRAMSPATTATVVFLRLFFW